jgi:hypothetical protein
MSNKKSFKSKTKKNEPTPVDKGIKKAKVVNMKVKDPKTGKTKTVSFVRKAKRRKPLKNIQLKCWAEAVAKVARGNPNSGRIKKGSPLYGLVRKEYIDCMIKQGYGKLLLKSKTKSIVNLAKKKLKKK